MLYNNDDVQWMINTCTETDSIKTLFSEYIEMNTTIVDYICITNCINDGSYESFDHYNSDVRDQFIRLFEEFFHYTKTIIYGFKVNASINQLISYAKKHVDKHGYCGYSMKEIEKLIIDGNVECQDTSFIAKECIVAKIINYTTGKCVYCRNIEGDIYIEAIDDILKPFAQDFNSDIEEISPTMNAKSYKLNWNAKSYSYFFGVQQVVETDTDFYFVFLNGKETIHFSKENYSYELESLVRI